MRAGRSMRATSSSGTRASSTRTSWLPELRMPLTFHVSRMDS